jgi:hypothetical protein
VCEGAADVVGDSLHDHRDGAVIGFGMLSALRRSELVAVTLADIERWLEGMRHSQFERRSAWGLLGRPGIHPG